MKYPERFRYYISLEDSALNSGVVSQEIEYVFFGRMTNPDQLKAAVLKEEHEQWELKIRKHNSNISSGTLRVRKVDSDEYIFTSKTITPGEAGKSEVELESTKDQFEQFKKMAAGGMLKTRYLFPVKGTEGTWKDKPRFRGCLIYEVDVFTKQDGNMEEWVKIDLEVPNTSVKAPAFPIDLIDVITNQPGKRTPAEENLINKLFSEKFITTHVVSE